MWLKFEVHFCTKNAYLDSCASMMYHFMLNMMHTIFKHRQSQTIIFLGHFWDNFATFFFVTSGCTALLSSDPNIWLLSNAWLVLVHWRSTCLQHINIKLGQFICWIKLLQYWNRKAFLIWHRVIIDPFVASM